MVTPVVTRVGASATEATTITIPAGHQAGDLLIIYGYSTGTTNLTLPAGWTSLGNDNLTTSYRLAYKIAGSSAETSGTWTNATGLIVAVYRNTATNKLPIGNQVNGSNSIASFTWTNSSLTTKGGSWVILFAATSATTSNIETTPTGFTNVVDVVGATCEYVMHESNGAYPSGTTAIAGFTLSPAQNWRSHWVEIRPEFLTPINNYQFVRVGDGMSTGEKLR